jgi:hypothetical protein
MTNSMEPSRSWEANIFPSAQEITSIFLNSKIEYARHESSHWSILSQMNSIHTPILHL